MSGEPILSLAQLLLALKTVSRLDVRTVHRTFDWETYLNFRFQLNGGNVSNIPGIPDLKEKAGIRIVVSPNQTVVYTRTTAHGDWHPSDQALILRLPDGQLPFLAPERLSAKKQKSFGKALQKLVQTYGIEKLEFLRLVHSTGRSTNSDAELEPKFPYADILSRLLAAARLPTRLFRSLPSLPPSSSTLCQP